MAIVTVVDDETDRLDLRGPRLADAEDLFKFLGDADAMRWTIVMKDTRACRRHIAGHDRQQRIHACIDHP